MFLTFNLRFLSIDHNTNIIQSTIYIICTYIINKILVKIILVKISVKPIGSMYDLIVS